MKLIILPGNSASNKEWADAADLAFSADFKNRHKQYYRHWNTGEDFINPDVEIDDVVKKVGIEALEVAEDYVVCAKSAGAMITVKAVCDGKLAPKKSVFVGFPLTWALKNNFPLDTWLAAFDIPTIIIQNSNDPVTPFGELQSTLSALSVLGKSNIKLIEIPGDDHAYMDFALIKEKIGDFLTK